MLSFKRDGNGTWMYSQKRTGVEEGSRWGVNPLSFRYGYICFGDGNKVLGERLVSVSQPMPDVTELPTRDFLGCRSGASTSSASAAGTRASRRVSPTTVGGAQSAAGLIETVRDRLNGASTTALPSPIVLLKKDTPAPAVRPRTPLEIVDRCR
jgi:hypothetical protein